jgi:TetR/AcrR family transcriptional regulator of autoinduction and epiphytic fitness
MGMLNEFSLWPWMIGRDRALAPDKDVVDEAIQMFLRRYRRAASSEPTKHSRLRSRSPTGRS